MVSSGICMLFSAEDGKDWCEYLKKILNKAGTQNHYLEIEGSPEDHSLLQSCQVIALLLTSALSQSFGEKTNHLCDIINNHSCVVVIYCYTDESDLVNIQKHCPRLSFWKTLTTGQNKAENTNMIANLVGVLDEKIRMQEKSKRSIPKRQKPVTIIPDHVFKIKEKVAIIFKEPPTGTVQVKIGNDGKIHDTKKLNGYTFLLCAPRHSLGWTTIKVLVDANVVTEIPFCYQEPFLSGFNSVGFLAQSLKVANGDVETLDIKLAEIYEQSIPEDLSLHYMVHNYPHHFEGKSSHTLPTLLHFAAKHGLAQLCGVLLDTPGSLHAFQIENRDGMDPADIAEMEGHNDLAEFMRMFIETAAVVEACDELYVAMKGLHLYKNESQLDVNKQTQKEATDTPVKKKKKLPPVPKRSMRLPKSRDSSIEEVPEEDDLTDDKLSQRQKEKLGTDESSDPTYRPETQNRALPDPLFASEELYKMKNRRMSPASLGSTAQEELCEIGRGVSEGEFSIHEAEMLYTSWKERNSDKSVSVKQRHKALEELRSTYATTFFQAERNDTELGRKSLLQKVKSKFKIRKKSIKEADIFIEHTTYETLPRSEYRGFRDFARSSTSSSSSASSRESMKSTCSRDSAIQRSGSDDEDEEEIVNRRENQTTGDPLKRLTIRETFIKQTMGLPTLDEPPPVPPRTPRHT